ncbi:electron transfer flavoprotein beta subunit lysine methyltransferase-like isoform X1 [Halictus rubicundus]|uniref:electron transfer flavoprotein beta subunit lysine methyltransferase-like isoform X1 n=1 Tax=Halictus rubicundus TaxID=77578 RepID=UPI0040356275
MKYNDSSGDNEQRLERSRASIGQPPCSLGIPGTLSKRKLDIECVALRLRRGKDDSGLRGDREKSAMPNIWKTWNRVTGSRCIPRACILDPEVVRAISSNTEISRNHMTPEIELFLLTPNCDLYHAPFSSVLEADETKRRVFAEPFWSIYWPGGQALTRFILDHGKNIFSSSAKRVLDLGAGCGAAAIAAKLVGAETVVANDIDKVACVAASMNAALNHVDVQVSQENLLQRTPGKLADVIFVGDMLYDEEIADLLTPWLEKARENGTQIFLADPGRHGLTEHLRTRISLIGRYSLPENVRRENYGYHKCEIWEYRGSRRNCS